MQRVLIVGCPGAGKSVAAKALGDGTGLPVVHLDRHYWRPGWTRPDNQSWRRIVGDLASAERWIIDGTYGSTLGLRLSRADTVIHLDYPTPLCMSRVVTRTLTGWGSDRRGELAPGCPERFDWEFLSFVARYQRDSRALDIQRMAGFTGRFHRFTRPRELAFFLDDLRSPVPCVDSHGASAVAG